MFVYEHSTTTEPLRLDSIKVNRLSNGYTYEIKLYFDVERDLETDTSEVLKRLDFYRIELNRKLGIK